MAYRIYTVRNGDSLWTIAQRFNTSIEQLVADNRIDDPELIYPGQRLRVNVGSESRPIITYVVNPGDTVYTIARRFHTTVQDIVRLNGLTNPDVIYPGQILRVR